MPRNCLSYFIVSATKYILHINCENIPCDLLSLSIKHYYEKVLERSDWLEDDESNLDLHRSNSQETITISNTPSSEKISTARGEGSSRY